MTKKNQTYLGNLVELKLEVIMHHKGEENEYLRQSIARDACYSAHNSIQYKTQQMSELKAEMASLRPAEGSEVIDIKLAKKLDIYDRMSDEYDELQDRFEADKMVFKSLTGEEWKPWKKSSNKDVSQVINKLDKIFGKDDKKIQEAN